MAKGNTTQREKKLIMDAMQGTYSDLCRNMELTPYQWRRVRTLMQMAYMYGRLALITEQERFTNEEKDMGEAGRKAEELSG